MQKVVCLYFFFVLFFFFTLRPVLKHRLLSFLRNIVSGLDSVLILYPVREYGDLNAVGKWFLEWPYPILPSKQFNSTERVWGFPVMHCAGLCGKHKDEQDEEDYQRALQGALFCGGTQTEAQISHKQKRWHSHQVYQECRKGVVKHQGLDKASQRIACESGLKERVILIEK